MDKKECMLINDVIKKAIKRAEDVLFDIKMLDEDYCENGITSHYLNIIFICLDYLKEHYQNKLEEIKKEAKK